MTLQQAIDVLEYRHKWFNIKTINATLGDVHALFSFQEKWQSEYGTNPFDDRVMMDAIAVIIDHHRSPSRPQESDTEPKGPFYEAKKAALDYIQKAKDGPTPEKYKPKKGDFLRCKYGFETAREIYGAAPFIIGKDYPVVEKGQWQYDTHDFAVKNELGNPHGFYYETWDEFFDLVVADKAEPFTPKEGDVLIAIDPCVIEGGRHDGMASLTVNNEYRVMEDYGSLIVVINDFVERHEFTLETIHKYFKLKPKNNEQIQ